MHHTRACDKLVNPTFGETAGLPLALPQHQFDHTQLDSLRFELVYRLGQLGKLLL